MIHTTSLLPFKKINFQDLAKLSQKFEENVLDATKKFEKLITNKIDIEGLPSTALGLAAQTAVSKVSSLLLSNSLVVELLLLFLFFVLFHKHLCKFCRVMKMLQLKMVHGSLHWMLQVSWLSCNMLEIGA